MADHPLVAELRRVLYAELPEWKRDLLQTVPDAAVKDLVSDFAGYRIEPRSPLNSPPATANPVDAAPVRTGNDGVNWGWREAPQLKPQPGIDLIDRMCQTQDAIDRAERIRQLAEATVIQRAEAALKEQEGKERKDKESK
jgi:hypothetical protein